MGRNRSGLSVALLLLVLLASTGAGPAHAAGAAKGSRQWISQWSWNVALGGPEYGGTTTLITVVNPADPAKGGAAANVQARFYLGACKTGSLFSEGGGAQQVAPGGVALLFPYPVPESGAGSGCLWILSDLPVLVSGNIQSASINPVSGFSDTRVIPLEFWPSKWAVEP
jgi:hypothetical protein